MRILLIEPIGIKSKWPIDLFITNFYFRICSLSLLQLAAYFPKETQVIDGVIDQKLTPKQLAEIAKKYNHPDDVIGIGCHSNAGAINSLYNLKLLKSYAPHATLIVGGYHATFFPEMYLKFGADLVIRHEAEITYHKILDKIQAHKLIDDNDLLGASYSLEWLNRINNQSQINSFLQLNQLEDPSAWQNIYRQALFLKNLKFKSELDRPLCKNLDEIPIPAREKLDYTKNVFPFEGKGYTTTMETARGCPYRCRFCSSNAMWGGSQRYKSVDRILEEIDVCQGLGIKKFFLVDESWGINVKRDSALTNALLENHYDISWGIQIRVDTVLHNPVLMANAAKSGCKLAFVGYETVNQKINDLCDKGIRINTYRKVRQILKSNDMTVLGYFITGLPGETVQSTRNVMGIIDQLSDIAFLQPFVPYFKEAFTPTDVSDNKEWQFKDTPVFYLDYRKLSKHTKSLEDEKNQQKIMNLLRVNTFNFTFSPKYFPLLFKHKTRSDRNMQVFRRFYYENVIRMLFKFRPEPFFNFLKGF